jgi:hypothetical protein
MTRRNFFVVMLLVLLGAGLATAADEPAAKLAARPITTAGGKVGDLLRLWWKEGTAAGNVGDFYDNRDGSHSDLDMNPYPQLQKIQYTKEDIKQRRHWAAQRVILPHVVFGNSSTSAPFHLGGSNSRLYYTAPAGLAFLHQQYTRNNIYIYPEHRDHDPGHNGANDGFGDAFPTNTPYLITSQGSSGSDQPFMRALPFTLAAFRPEVKKKLIEAGLLMPTVQMILRASNRHLKEPAEYLTGKAHPSVFEGSWVDDLKMIQQAHDIRLEDIPPMVQLKVVEEDHPVVGRDFFETGGTEKLADTPCVIARILRGKAQKRRIIVSAEESRDVNKKPLKYHWVVLRGDAKRIHITTVNPEGSRAEIVVGYHERRPIAPGSAMESNRVDIGVFVHNGKYYSAPGFVTFFSLDHEARTYDDKGRIVEIGCGMGEAGLRVTNWPKFLDAAASSSAAARRLLPFSAEERAALGKAAAKLRELEAAKLKPPEKDKAIRAVLDQPLGGKKASVRRSVEQSLEELLHRVGLTDDLAGLHSQADAAGKAAEEAARRRLLAFGVLKDPKLTIYSLRFEGVSPKGTLTPYEKLLVDQFHASLVSALGFPGMVTPSFQVNYVDPRLSAPRTWRDVYRYDAAGNYLGWTRYTAEGKTDFNPDGLTILKKDALGRCLEGRTVRYVRDPQTAPGPNTNPLRQLAGDEIVTYEYAGEQDWTGKATSRKR